MKRGYWLGMGLTLGLLSGAGWLFSTWFLPQPPMFVAFASPLLDRSDAPIPYGQSAEFRLQFQNKSSQPVRVDAVNFDQPFAILGDCLTLPYELGSHSTLTIPVKVSAEKPHWGEYPVTVRTLVANRRTSQIVSTVILCDIAAHLNPDPPLIQFGRVRPTTKIPLKTIRLWSPSSSAPLLDFEVDSNDPAVRVTAKPLQLVDRGRRYQWELQVEIDATQAQPQHRSQIVVRTRPEDPQVIIPVVGWVDGVASPEKER